MFGLGTWTWQQTRLRKSYGAEAGEPDFMRVLMQANDPKRDLSFSEKELWLEVFMMAAIGESSQNCGAVAALISSAHHAELTAWQAQRVSPL